MSYNYTFPYYQPPQPPTTTTPIDIELEDELEKYLNDLDRDREELKLCKYYMGAAAGVEHVAPPGWRGTFANQAEREKAIKKWQRVGYEAPLCPETGERVDVEAWEGELGHFRVFYVCNTCRDKVR